MRILFVDDHEVMRVSLSMLLSEMGHQVIEASSVAEARGRLEQPGPGYDVVLLDFLLKDGKGSDLVPDIRKRAPGAKIVLLSGTARWDPSMDVDLMLEDTLDPNALARSIQKLSTR